MPQDSMAMTLASIKPPRVYTAGELIFRQGEPARAFYYLQSGMTQAYTVGAGGKLRNVMTTWPGKFFSISAFFDGAPHASSEVALERSVIFSIDMPVYERLRMRRPDLQGVLLASISHDMITVFEQLADSSLLDADQKVARFFCRRVERGQYTTRDGAMTVSHTQSFIARVLGLSRCTVSQVLARFRERGWIDTRYGTIRLLDYDSIRAFVYGK